MHIGAVNFFSSVIKQTMMSRKDEDSSRADFIQLMKNASAGNLNVNKEDEHEVETHATTSNKSGFSEIEILGNSLIFIMAGFDTTSIGLTQLLYCLATNPDCQQQVHEEIDKVIGSKENVTYDDMMRMHYLDQCMQESLRLYPPAPRLDRVACRDVEINGVLIPKDTAVVIPVYALHIDPEIFEDPWTFNPDRFTVESKAKRNPIVWLPFGYGPRNCIAMRLALYEMKVAVVHIMRTHKLVKCSKTEDPIVWQKGMWLKPKNGIWLQAEKRT